MNPDELLDCPKPEFAEPGDVWYCPGCARKYYCALITIEDKNIQFLAWTTTEIG